ncbi:hypothetical protein [Streptomyces sp. NPDC015242]|uniref:hypothetical protein n=1 Tax=Streptomyces sp. NPDC015242 TaxID=3364951 RepID=UPI0036FA4146
MRTRLLPRAAVLLLVLVALQGGAPALAAEGGGGGGGGRSGSIDPLTPFAQGASALAGMAQPFYTAFSQAVSPPRA